MTTLKPINRICPNCGNGNYMRFLNGEHVGRLNVKCLNCNHYFVYDELPNSDYRVESSGICKGCQRFKAKINDGTHKSKNSIIRCEHEPLCNYIQIRLQSKLYKKFHEELNGLKESLRLE